jgi:hypothetical protein
MIHFRCPACKATLNVADEQGGSKLPCPKCGQRLQVPGKVATAPSPAAPAPTKACPYCAETILAAARLCKHCGQALDPDLRKRQRQDEPDYDNDERPRRGQQTPQGGGSAGSLDRAPRGSNTLLWLVVGGVAAVVLLVVLGVGLFLLVGYTRYLETAKASKAKMDCSHISQAVESYNIENDHYPNSLLELTQPVGDKPAYLTEKDLLDPWDRPYQYDPNARNLFGKPKVFTTSSGVEINNW